MSSTPLIMTLLDWLKRLILEKTGLRRAETRTDENCEVYLAPQILKRRKLIAKKLELKTKNVDLIKCLIFLCAQVSF
jgi:hypothetical protein